MKDTRKKIEYLLLKSEWSSEDQQWMLDYLENGDPSLLQKIARQRYNDDINSVERIIDAKLSERILKDIHRRIKATGRRRELNRFMVLAATLLLLIAAAYMFYHFPHVGNKAVHYLEVNTRPGHNKKLSLSDGTEVWLSPASKLRYPERFDGDKREIQLSGEAFFKVAKDASKPFIVHAGGLRTRILGTSFNVVAYKDRNYATVTVATGKVAVKRIKKHKAPAIQLLPNQQIIFNKDNDGLTEHDFPDADKLLYDRRNGLLEYRGSALSNVIEDLQVQYGVKIRIDGNMNGCTYYGAINAHDPLDVSLKLICLALNAQLKRVGDTYVIIGGNC